MLTVLLFFSGSTAASQHAAAAVVFEDFPLPERLSLFNEPVPLNNPSVREMLEREFTIAVWDHAQVILWLKRAGRYFPVIEKKLAENGMPDDLKYVAVAESSLLTYGRSHKGALGPWQFIRNTARRNGLQSNRLVDERLHFDRATDSALVYLKKLHDLFGSWTLAVAAYNCGEARIGKEIKHQKVRDYYRLNLPLETERYVFRIAAAKIIMENPERYGYRIDPSRLYRPVPCDTIETAIRAPVHITDLAARLNTDFKVIREMNPHITGYYLPRGKHILHVPHGSGPDARAAIAALAAKARKAEAARKKDVYVVRAGDTLSHIALKNRTSVKTLQDLNGLESTVIYTGQKLRLRP